MAALWVCFTAPSREPASGDYVLSILPPLEEEALEKRYPGRVLRSREVSRPVRREALRRYLAAVGRLGCADVGGRSLRAALAAPEGGSLWWYHPSAFHDGETEPAFEWIIHALTVERVARDKGATGLILWGAPEELACCLRAGFSVEEYQARPAPPWAWVWLRALAARARGFAQLAAGIRASRRAPPARGPFDVLLSGFWDWSFWSEGKTLCDRYFKRLPEELAKRGLSYGWLAWYDPAGDPAKGPRPAGAVLAPLRGRRDVAFLQARLTLADLVARFGDFSPLKVWLRARGAPAVGAALKDGPFDWRPLLERQLQRGFLDASIPRFQAVELAARRAFEALRPRVSVNFLEANPHSRAIYVAAGGAVATVAVQHCSYAHEKSYISADPAFEGPGEDGLGAPRPQVLSSMGELAREIFLESGYGESRVLPLGSTRYDHVQGTSSPPRPAGGKPRALIVSALDLDLHIEIVEAACVAAEGLGVEVAVRDYPYNRIAEHPGFARWADRVTITSGTLAEDIARADVILFSNSTVAEEALLAGRPVWQWLPRSYNGSALAEVADIPRFSTIAQLREALVALEAGRVPAPDAAFQREVFRRLFSPGDGRAAERVADAVAGLVHGAR